MKLGIASELGLGFFIFMAALQLTTTIRIYVPNQEHPSILLTVKGDTPLHTVHAEIRYGIGKLNRGPTWIRAYKENNNTTSEPIYFMKKCTVAQALQEGAQCFEVYFTDLFG